MYAVVDLMVFEQFFEVYIADSELGKKLHYQIRYKVYCEELGYEEKLCFPDSLEMDNWDQESIHFLVREKLTDRWVGALRLITSNKQVLPIEQYFSFNQQEALVSRNELAEMSRLCVVSEMRRTNNKLRKHEVDKWLTLQNPNRLIIFGLINAALIYSEKLGIRYWLSLNERSLARLLSQKKLHMEKLGPPIFVNGLRKPYLSNVNQFKQNNFWHAFPNHVSLYSDIE